MKFIALTNEGSTLALSWCLLYKSDSARVNIITEQVFFYVSRSNKTEATYVISSKSRARLLTDCTHVLHIIMLPWYQSHRLSEQTFFHRYILRLSGLKHAITFNFGGTSLHYWMNRLKISDQQEKLFSSQVHIRWYCDYCLIWRSSYCGCVSVSYKWKLQMAKLSTAIFPRNFKVIHNWHINYHVKWVNISK